MKIHRGHKYRIYPAKSQIVRLAQFFGCCRFVYNHFLALRKNTYTNEKRNLSQYECMRLATELRGTLPWLADCDSMAIQEAIKDLNKAYVNFFEGRAKYPKFHKKSHDQSYRTRNQSNGIRIEGSHIVLPKIGKVKAKISRLPNGRIVNATVSRTASSKYYVSLCCEEELVPKPNACGIVALDLGIKELFVDSNGYCEPNPKTLARFEKKLRREQRSLSRMMEANIAGYDKNRKPTWKKPVSECKNIQKQRLKIAKIHEKIYNIRTDNLHKVTNRLVDENQIIAIESLNVKGMVRNHRLAKAISDASWGRFRILLEYKSYEHGTQVLKVPTFYPSSQTCSCCGYKNPRVKDLKVRHWDCPKCGASHDRDLNAAKNILAKALESA